MEITTYSKQADDVFSIVRSIPKGQVLSYKEVAERAGLSNPRQIGRILHNNPDPKLNPCHRVIRSDGTVADGYAFGGRGVQLDILRKEGVEIKGKKIVR